MKFTPLFVAIGAAFTAIATQAATYQVVELAPVDGYKNSFASAINNNNQIVGNLTTRFNFPIDITGVDFTNAAITGSLTAAEIEEVKKGNINAKALTVLLFYIQNNNNTDYRLQRLSNVYSSRLDTKELFNLRETATLKTNDEYLVDVSDRGEFLGYGSATFIKKPFTPAPTETTPNPAEQQLWTPVAGANLGVIASERGKITLPPGYTEYGGGLSIPRAINNTGRVIGLASMSMSDANIQSIKSTCTGKIVPVDICYYTLARLYDVKPVYWQLDGAGKPAAPVALGFVGDKGTGKAHTKTDYPAISYGSVLNDVNDRGLMVGLSTYSNSDEIVSVYSQLTGWQDVISSGNHAAIFDGNEIKTFIDVKRWNSSEAKAVNNKDLLVGYASEVVNGNSSPRFFVYDYATQKLTFPTTLFASANTVPEAVNDNGMVVGWSQNFIAGFAKPRQVGFLFDNVKGTFHDLNKLVPCNTPYNIAQAVDINEKNVIVANAVKEVDKRDSKGNVIRDAAGNPEKEEIPVAVQLIPIPNGTIDNCTAAPDTTYERKGAASGWVSLLLLPLLWFRRKRA